MCRIARCPKFKTTVLVCITMSEIAAFFRSNMNRITTSHEWLLLQEVLKVLVFDCQEMYSVRVFLFSDDITEIPATSKLLQTFQQGIQQGFCFSPNIMSPRN